VAIVASAKKCHTNEKSIFRTEGAVVVKKKGWGLLLHLLQAHLHSQNKRRKNFNRKSFYLLVSARKSAAGETSSLVNHKSLERNNIKNLNLLYYYGIIPDSYKNQ